ncbi:KEOPS complex subunit Pcc1 [Methanolapillus millepedarum]|uniref:KEOPS complex subunit Pcc1 n=1 Tax=Methanolapillus millepedarum TaxID=3028296 RepID=UPI0030B87931
MSKLKISGTIRFIEETDAERNENLSRKLVLSLEPDNFLGMTTKTGADCSEIHLESEKVGSILATADDLLMNADGAVRVKKSSEK